VIEWKFLPRHGTGIVLFAETITWLAFSVLGGAFGITGFSVVTLSEPASAAG
jgi:hypothetical protein